MSTELNRAGQQQAWVTIRDTRAIVFEIGHVRLDGLNTGEGLNGG